MKNRTFLRSVIIFLAVAAAIGLVFTPAMAQDGGEKEEFSADQIVTEGEFGPDMELEDSFGLYYQYTYIPSANFTPFDSSTTYQYGANGYRYLTAGTYMDTGISLPSGAYLVAARLFYYDNDATRNPGLHIWRYDNPASSNALCHITAPAGAPGYTNTIAGCSSINHTIRNGNTTYWARVELSGVAGTNLMFKGVRLYWYRQISPAPANATFNDVSPGDWFFQGVEALAAAGITQGCGGNNFCPNVAVTRAQMAVFLARALGLHWPS